jgi:uncharacterized glyoxalase superfamily protein PhnB
MSNNGANESQTITPMIAYEDGAAAVDWLVQAFGFREVMRMTDEDGRVGHAELELGGGVVYLASPTGDYESPRRHREHCDPARAWSTVPWVIDGVMAQVSDVDRHYRRAKDAGATILSGLEHEPFGRIYRAEDPEGHRWMFVQPTASEAID